MTYVLNMAGENMVSDDLSMRKLIQALRELRSQLIDHQASQNRIRNVTAKIRALEVIRFWLTSRELSRRQTSIFSKN